MTLLDELLENPTAKAVVFSQWLGTHELIVRRLGQADGQRAWGHVLFNGSVRGDKRGALVEQFHKDPVCRLSLSTDAGGVGLNLQHAAAVVVNMDLPWNPAVLEQRIGRVHRMGQSRGVQVVNFVGQGSIKEGMLSVLAFKQSLFAGVLDGSENEVFLQGTLSEAKTNPIWPLCPRRMQAVRQRCRPCPRWPSRPIHGVRFSKPAPRCCKAWRRHERPVAQRMAPRPSRSNVTPSRARRVCACRCPSLLCCASWPRRLSPGCGNSARYCARPSASQRNWYEIARRPCCAAWRTSPSS